MTLRSFASSVAATITSPGNDVLLNGYIPKRWHHKIRFKPILIVLLPCLSILALCITWLSARSDGMFSYIFGLVDKEGSSLPSSDDPLVTTYTGVRLVDHKITSYVVLIAPVLTFENQSLALFGIFAFGQMGAAWTLIMLESLRHGNRGRCIRWAGIFGTLFQILNLAVAIPWWLLLHVLTSPVARPFPGNHASRVLFVDTRDLRLLPLAITLGYLLPTILMTLPAPDWVTPLAHQKYIVSWHCFPIWTAMILWGLKKIYNTVLRYCSDKGDTTPTPQNTSYLKGVKYVYLFTLSICILTHLPVLFFALIPPWAIPTQLPNLTRLAAESLTSIYVPALPLSSNPFVFDKLVRNFFQYNAYIGFTALLLWAAFLYRNATVEKTLRDPETSLPQYNARDILSGAVRFRDEKLWKLIVWKISIWSLISGPMGALTVLLWERDAIVRQKIKQGI